MVDKNKNLYLKWKLLHVELFDSHERTYRFKITDSVSRNYTIFTHTYNCQRISEWHRKSTQHWWRQPSLESAQAPSFIGHSFYFTVTFWLITSSEEKWCPVSDQTYQQNLILENTFNIASVSGGDTVTCTDGPLHHRKCLSVAADMHVASVERVAYFCTDIYGFQTLGPR